MDTIYQIKNKLMMCLGNKVFIARTHQFMIFV